MKKHVFLLVAVFLSLTASSQLEEPSFFRRYKPGYNISVPYSLLRVPELPANAEVVSYIGFRAGLLLDYELNDWLWLSPEIAMSYNGGTIVFTNSGSQSEYLVAPATAEFMIHLKFLKENKPRSPYIHVGPNLRWPVPLRSLSAADFGTNTDLGINAAVGFRKEFAFFTFSPEIRYTIGLLDVNQNPQLKYVHHDTIALVFNLIM